MRIWKAAALGAVIVVAAPAFGAVPHAVTHGQEVRAAQPPRAVAITTGGSRIGVSVRDVDGTEGVEGGARGVIVEDVTADSPAGKAGLRKGDVIVEFDEERVRSARQLTRIVRETPAGRSVPAVVRRGGQTTTLTVVPDDGGRLSLDGLDDFGQWARDLRARVHPRASAPGVPPRPPAPPIPPQPFLWNFEEMPGRSGRLGLTAGALSPQLAEYFGVREGALVTSVTDDSAAAKAGLRAGDVITAINGATVSGPADVRRRTQGLSEGEEFTMTVMRERKAVTLKGKAEGAAGQRTGRTVL